ncbi:MAG: FAD-binding protein [Verrucomicrobiota bacterium]|nr:FAD-binding protein [Verrucomicrobiota bacterium]
MTEATLRELQKSGADVRADRLTRLLYATDASIYQIEPAAVAFPPSAAEASALLATASEAGLAITPRGAGTSLVGNAIGDGLIVDFSRHNRQITDLDLEKRSVRVGAGVVLDQLNAFLKPRGFCFGPDVATSSRATIGGMIANNSSGARVPIYGTTADHVRATEIVLADGRIAQIGSANDGLHDERERIAAMVHASAAEIAEQMPPGIIKRWPGYGIERFSRAPQNLNEIFAGSEGTLGAIFSAELKISPLPRAKGLGLIFFASVDEAMQATVSLLDLKPAAIEHIDRPLLDQTRGQLHFQGARDLMELDAKPCAAILLVEFYDDAVEDRLQVMQRRGLGLRSKTLTDASEMNLVWAVRKAGLSLLTGCIGAAKPVAFIEDAAVRPEQLPEYVRGLEAMMKSQHLEASYYGHAASGLLHVRPVVDLHRAGDRKKFRQIADETSALVKQFKGSLSAEHGVGIARTAYMRAQLGDELLDLMREIKRVFDPRGRMNPGKIFDTEAFRIDSHLRQNFETPLTLPFEPRLAFAFKDGSFIGNLEQCNGCGGCRKDAPTMCPTFLATGEEIMSTRGRANVIRQVLQWRETGSDPLRSPELDDALSNCLSCKACTNECPSNVNLALLKAELRHAAHKKYGIGLRERILSRPDLLGELGCVLPRLANSALNFSPLRQMMQGVLGLSAQRTLPAYASERFDHWFASKCSGDLRPPDGAHRAPLQDVILWDDTFVRYHEPHIGKAAVRVLEALGCHVTLAHGRKCCGRPAFSQGNLDVAAKFGAHNLALLSSLQNSTTPILFLEPSCYSMFAEDYRELRLDGAEEIAQRCYLFEQFIENTLATPPVAHASSVPVPASCRNPATPAHGSQPTRFTERTETVAIHAHCHAKSLINPAFMARLVERLPGRRAKILETGCCGMAGAFGMTESKRKLSEQVAAPMLEKIRAEGAGVTLIASGTSCRHQISELSDAHPKHMAEFLADALLLPLDGRHSCLPSNTSTASGSACPTDIVAASQ